MNIEFNVDTRDVSRWLLSIADKHMPFACAQTLTRSAKDGQFEVIRQLPRRFIIRNTWVEKGIRITPARKDNLESSVYTKDDFMQLQDEGGTKRPRGRHLALPTSNVKRSKRDIITRSKRPAALKQKRDVFKGTIHGVEGLYQRQRGKGNRGRLKLLFAFEGSAKVRARFEFEKTVVDTVKGRVERHFGLALQQALQSAR